jgi:hypothetical protein
MANFMSPKPRYLSNTTISPSLIIFSLLHLPHHHLLILLQLINQKFQHHLCLSPHLVVRLEIRLGNLSLAWGNMMDTDTSVYNMASRLVNSSTKQDMVKDFMQVNGRGVLTRTNKLEISPDRLSMAQEAVRSTKSGKMQPVSGKTVIS